SGVRSPPGHDARLADIEAMSRHQPARPRILEDGGAEPIQLGGQRRRAGFAVAKERFHVRQRKDEIIPPGKAVLARLRRIEEIEDRRMIEVFLAAVAIAALEAWIGEGVERTRLRQL